MSTHTIPPHGLVLPAKSRLLKLSTSGARKIAQATMIEQPKDKGAYSDPYYGRFYNDIEFVLTSSSWNIKFYVLAWGWCAWGLNSGIGLRLYNSNKKTIQKMEIGRLKELGSPEQLYEVSRRGKSSSSLFKAASYLRFTANKDPNIVRCGTDYPGSGKKKKKKPY